MSTTTPTAVQSPMLDTIGEIGALLARLSVRLLVATAIGALPVALVSEFAHQVDQVNATGQVGAHGHSWS